MNRVIVVQIKNINIVVEGFDKIKLKGQKETK